MARSKNLSPSSNMHFLPALPPSWPAGALFKQHCPACSNKTQQLLQFMLKATNIWLNKIVHLQDIILFQFFLPS